eukprot:6510051-Karenia_brevis.AAC.1
MVETIDVAIDIASTYINDKKAPKNKLKETFTNAKQFEADIKNGLQQIGTAIEAAKQELNIE